MKSLASVQFTLFAVWISEVSYELSLFIEYENVEWCHFVVRIGSLRIGYRLFYFIVCVSFLSISCFLWILLLAEVFL